MISLHVSYTYQQDNGLYGFISKILGMFTYLHSLNIHTNVKHNVKQI